MFGAVNIMQLKRGYDKNKIRAMDGKERARPGFLLADIPPRSTTMCRLP